MSLPLAKSIEADLQTISCAGEDDDKPKNAAVMHQPRSLCDKIKLVLLNITVEPILLFYVFPSVMRSLATQNLNLEKACRVNLGYDPAVCDALSARNSSGYTEKDEQEVQRLVSSAYAVKNVIQSFVPAMLLLFLGSWSDRHRRRKPCMIVPLIGDIVAILGIMVSVFYYLELPLEFPIFFEAVPPSLTGGWFAMFMGVFSYISGISTVEMRTIRIGAVNIFSSLSLTIGVASSGILYKLIGFLGVYSISLSMYIIGLLYATFLVKEAPSNEELEPEQKVGKKKSFLADLFDTKSVKDTIKVAFKEGKRNRKRRICTVMFVFMVIIGPFHGESNVLYLFVRYKFGWDVIDYSLFAATNFVADLFVDDAILGMISTTSKVCDALMYAFAPNGKIFYLGAFLEMFNGTAFIAVRSIVSKLVPSDELGKINSLFGVCEALVPIVYGPMYSMLYRYTIDTFPSAFYLLGGALLLLSVLVFFWLYTESRKDKIEMEKEQNEDFLNR